MSVATRSVLLSFIYYFGVLVDKRGREIDTAALQNGLICINACAQQHRNLILRHYFNINWSQKAMVIVL
jgi:hypothetical protein